MTKGQPDYSAGPKTASHCVVVFHEVWGPARHFEEVCKRLGKLGFAATTPNLYRGYEELLTPDNVQRAMEGVWGLSLEERRDRTKVARALDKKGVGDVVREAAFTIYNPTFRDELLEKALAAVRKAQQGYDSVTTLGFCLGGGLSLKCATKNKHLVSAISFYGPPPVLEDVPKIVAPILDIHAYEDEIINKSVPAWVGAMLEGGKDLTLKTYPRTKHGFFNDTRKDVYNRGAAGEAWDITRWFLERTPGRH